MYLPTVLCTYLQSYVPTYSPMYLLTVLCTCLQSYVPAYSPMYPSMKGQSLRQHRLASQISGWISLQPCEHNCQRIRRWTRVRVRVRIRFLPYEHNRQHVAGMYVYASPNANHKNTSGMYVYASPNSNHKNTSGMYVYASPNSKTKPNPDPGQSEQSN